MRSRGTLLVGVLIVGSQAVANAQEEHDGGSVQAFPPEAPSEPAPAADPAPSPASEPPVASAPPVAASPQALDGACVPACRPGFICASGRCASACNPPCASGLECDGAGQCVYPPRQIAEELQKMVEERDEEKARLTERRHDGIYIRLGMNIGYVFDRSEIESFEFESKGVGVDLDLAFGVTALPGLVLGFGWNSIDVSSGRTTENGEAWSDDHNGSFDVYGWMVDYFPNDEQGLHVTGTLGFGSADLDARNNSENGLGLGVAAGGGYDFWIAEQWSLGVMARVLVIAGATDEFGDHRAIIPAVTASLLHH